MLLSRPSIFETRRTPRSIRAVPLCCIPSARLLGIGLPRPAWARLIAFRTGVRTFQSALHKSVLGLPSICECSALDQIAANAILKCSLHRAPIGDIP